MKITNNVEMKGNQELLYKAGKKNVDNNKTENVTDKEKTVEVTLSNKESSSVISDKELECALENIMASESSIFDVEQAQAMIREANQKIYENADESVLAQANQTNKGTMSLLQ